VVLPEGCGLGLDGARAWPARAQPADELAHVDAHLAEGAGGPGGALRTRVAWDAVMPGNQRQTAGLFTSVVTGAGFSGHRTVDLVVDRVYLGGPQPHWGADPVQHLLGVGLQGGIRAKGGLKATQLVALRTSGADPDWPDTLDLSTGTVTYLWR
jgi:hypothetical protein